MSRIYTVDQLLDVLDQMVSMSGRGDRSDASAAQYWTGLLTTPGHPLTTQLPDEPLVDWGERGLLGDLSGARVLDVGCGGGRNTRWFAEQGATVEGLDLAADLRTIFGALTPVELRAVRPDREDTFGPDFLNAALFVAD